MISVTNDTAPASTAAEANATRTTRKPERAQRRAHGAAKKGKKATPAKKTNLARRKAKAGNTGKGGPNGTKTAKVLDFLRRPGGVTGKELMKVTGWRAHSVRGFLSGTVNKKMGLHVVSAKGEDGERNYSIKG